MDEWFDFLYAHRVLPHEYWRELKRMHNHRMPSVVNKAIEFANRMKGEHPDLWLAFRSKQRILGG